MQWPSLFLELTWFIPFLGTARVSVFSEMVIAKCMMNACNTEKIVEISVWSKGIAGGRVISRLETSQLNLDMMNFTVQ